MKAGSLRHEAKGLSFSVPDTWQDRTVVAYAAPSEPGKLSAANMVVTTDVLGAGETLRTYSSRQVMNLAGLLEGLELMEHREVNVGGVPAVKLVMAWTSPSGRVVQQLVLVAIHSDVWSFTGTMPFSQ